MQKCIQCFRNSFGYTLYLHSCVQVSWKAACVSADGVLCCNMCKSENADSALNPLIKAPSFPLNPLHSQAFMWSSIPVQPRTLRLITPGPAREVEGASAVRL